MNKIELKPIRQTARSAMEIFNKSKIGQAFKVVGSDINTIAMKCYSDDGTHRLVDLADGYEFYAEGDENTSFTQNKLVITPIKIKVTEL